MVRAMLPDPEADLPALLQKAIERRGELLAVLHGEDTDCYRLLHGVVEGAPGLTIDRYGPLLLLQTFRAPLPALTVEALATVARAALGLPLQVVCNHRGEPPAPDFPWHQPAAEALQPVLCREASVRFRIQARHRGQDPWLFLDLRAGRRRLCELAPGRSVLNLFAYTCGAGIAAAKAGAREVVNVDFADSALAVGRQGAVLNDLPPSRCTFFPSDCLPVLRQLAGVPVQRGGRRRPYPRFPRRTFDLVLLDPPRWSKGPFGAVDVVRDYASLFKPCVLALAPGGTVLATNHVPEVAPDEWLASLHRIAAKAGRPLRSAELLAVDADFPSFDAQPPLKVAVCTA